MTGTASDARRGSERAGSDGGERCNKGVGGIDAPEDDEGVPGGDGGEAEDPDSADTPGAEGCRRGRQINESDGRGRNSDEEDSAPPRGGSDGDMRAADTERRGRAGRRA